MHQVADIGEVKRVGPITVDSERFAAQGVFDECLADAPTHAAFAVKRGRSHYRIRQPEHLVVGDHQLFAAVFERAVNSHGIAMPILGNSVSFEIAVYHRRGKVDEMPILASCAVKRVLQGAKAVIEGAERVLVGAIGVRNGSQLDDGVRLNVGKTARKNLVVARVDHMQRNIDLAQRIQALINELHIQLLGRVAGTIGECAQVVHLQAVDDMHLGAMSREIESQVVPDESGAANERHAAPLQ